MSKHSDLKAALEEAFIGEGKGAKLLDAFGELTLEVPLADYIEVARTLKADPRFGFAQMLDLCAVDYSGYGGQKRFASRYAIVLHLLSLRHNWRLRVRTQLADVEGGEKAVAPTLTPVWDCANWFEREAYDLMGIRFEGHPDMRRILTDYYFKGHPLRKDFPMEGTVEMHYDEEAGQVAYRPVTIEHREVTPRIVREADYGREAS